LSKFVRMLRSHLFLSLRSLGWFPWIIVGWVPCICASCVSWCVGCSVTVSVMIYKCYTMHILLLIYWLHFPIASLKVTYRDCKEIVDACKEAGVMLAVCHVLRYTEQAIKLRELIKAGAIGEVVSIQHMEPVCETFAFVFLALTFVFKITSYFNRVLVCVLRSEVLSCSRVEFWFKISTCAL